LRAEKLTPDELAAEKRAWLRHHQLDLHVIVNLIFGYHADLLPITGERKVLLRDLKGRIDRGILRATLRAATADVYASVGLKDLHEHLSTDIGHRETHEVLAAFFEEWRGIADVSIESLQTEAASGAPGRPTSRHLVEEEMRRRFASGIAESSLRAEARHLLKWLKQHHPKAPTMTEKTIENAFRELYRSLKVQSRPPAPKY
jgi:hypothetical protein